MRLAFLCRQNTSNILLKKYFPHCKYEKTKIRNKTDKTWKTTSNNYCLGCKGFTHNFRLKEVKITKNVLREKLSCVVGRSNKSIFLKQKHNKN